MTTYADLFARYRARHGALREPVQGWDSLAPALHLAYSIGRVRGFTDLGTYVDKQGDHGGTYTARRPPAWAFDLGRRNRFYNRGWNYWAARRLAKLYVREHEALAIEYVILGRRIWSREKGWHAFTRDSSHLWHLHVSGHWPGR